LQRNCEPGPVDSTSKQTISDSTPYEQSRIARGRGALPVALPDSPGMKLSDALFAARSDNVTEL